MKLVLTILVFCQCLAGCQIAVTIGAPHRESTPEEEAESPKEDSVGGEIQEPLSETKMRELFQELRDGGVNWWEEEPFTFDRWLDDYKLWENAEPVPWPSYP